VDLQRRRSRPERSRQLIQSRKDDRRTTEAMNGSGERSALGQAESVEPELAPPPYQRIREVRLAVVMYGGVSLAIYMNGVAQELYHLVRSTAPSSPKRRDGHRADGDLLTEQESQELRRSENEDDYAEPEEWALPAKSLSGSERVYRQLGQLLGREQEQREPAREDDPILTRFVIDILSGTSAGGINAVFLAKALANNQSMKALSTLWIEEGDISKLLNDSKSTKDLPGVALSSPPTSLLNGHRMYYELLRAFDGMDEQDESGRSSLMRISPLADELDLYVTTTDLVGLLLPIRLRNRVIDERRYKNVFHFVYSTAAATGEHRNDFHADNNAALAFVSRCTSSFPFAFEPMTLEDINPVVQGFESQGVHPYDIQRHGSSAGYWQNLFPDYASPAPNTIPYNQRPFGDGGALDNKPFSYATEAVLRRRADLPVDRKLLFIEPDPGHPERTREADPRPDVIQNFLDQGVTLPRQETIREDLQRIAERNRMIQRIDRILLDVERAAPARQTTTRRTSGDEWASRDPRSEIQEIGHAYGGYHRLKVAAVTDDLTSLVARVAGLEEGSDYEVAVRAVVGAWRRHRYAALGGVHDVEAGSVKRSENRFLVDFDLAFRLRRLNYIQRKLDQLYPLDESARKLLFAVMGQQFSSKKDEDVAALRDEVLYFKRVTSSIHANLRKAGRDLRSKSDANPIRLLVGAMGMTRELLDVALALPDATARDKWGEQQRSDHEAALDELGRTTAAQIGGACRDASERLQRALDRRDENANELRRLISNFVRTTYDTFDDYDMVAFPMTYGTDAGETDVIEVIRVSPEDTSRALRDPSGQSKVTGARYMHFGAFLDRIWRQNDILRGRLDAADILISSLVPQAGDGMAEATRQRDELVMRLKNEAQRAILSEELKEADRSKLAGLIAEAVTKLTPEDRDAEHLKELLEKDGVPLQERLMPVLRLAMNDEEALRRFYVDDYEVDAELPPQEAARTLGRGAHITGQMFGGVAESRSMKPLGRASVWVSRFGQLVSGVTEAAIPGRLWHMFVFHSLVLLYVFEGLAIFLGLLLNNGVVQRFGIFALALTLTAHVLLLVSGDWLSGGRGYRVIVRVILVLLLLGVLTLVVIGVRHAPEDARNLWTNIQDLFK